MTEFQYVRLALPPETHRALKELQPQLNDMALNEMLRQAAREWVHRRRESLEKKRRPGNTATRDQVTRYLNRAAGSANRCYRSYTENTSHDYS